MSHEPKTKLECFRQYDDELAGERDCDHCTLEDDCREPRDRADGYREILGFLSDLCSPERHGFEVPRSVRKRARTLANVVEDLAKIP